MAIFHCSVKIIGRSTGRSAVAAAAYRSAEKLLDQRQGVVHDYTRKGGVIHSQIILPKNAPAEYRHRETLWNAVENAEKDGKAQLAREVEVALPIELDYRECIMLLREYVQSSFVSQGMAADIAIHDKGDGNPHAHILLTLRPMDETGKWQNKAEKVYLCRNRQDQEQGFTAKELRGLPAGEWEKQLPYYKNGKGKPHYLTKHIAETDSRYSDFIRVKGKNSPKKAKQDRVNATLEKWNDPGNVEIWRQQWAVLCNSRLEKKEVALLDHRSYKRQNKEQTATIHMGKDATALERRGIKTARGRYNDAVRAENRAYAESIREVRKELDDIAEKRKQRTAELRKRAEAVRQKQYIPRSPDPAIQENQSREKYRTPKAEKISMPLEAPQRPQEAFEVTWGHKYTTSTPNTPYIASEGAGEGVSDTGQVIDASPEADNSALEPFDKVDGTYTAPEHKKPLQAAWGLSEGMPDDDVPAKETAEQVAEQLIGLGDKYINLAVEVAQAKREEKNLLEDKEYYKHAPDEIASRVNDIFPIQQRKQELEAQRDKLGLFSGRMKRELGEEIKRISEILQAESSRYLRDYNNRQPAEAIEHAKRNELRLEAEIRKLPDIRELESARDTAKQEYMREVKSAFRREDGRQISELIKRGKVNKQSIEKKPLDDIIAEAGAKTEMRNFEIEAAKQVGIRDQERGHRERDRGLER